MNSEWKWDEPVYQELRRSARSLCRRERLLLTLQPTALLHEAFLRLRDYSSPASVADQIRIVQRVMRNVLIDRVRRLRAIRRGGHQAVRVELTEGLAPVTPIEDEMGDMADLIDRLARVSPRQARVFRLRAIDGFEVTEVARILSICPRTVKSEWAAAKEWLSLRIRNSAV